MFDHEYGTGMMVGGSIRTRMLVALGALALLACGDDDDLNADGGEAPPAHEQRAETVSSATVALAALPGVTRSPSPGFRDDMGEPTVIDPEMYMPTMGDARLRTTPEGVDLALHLKGCVPYLQGYPLRVHEGDSCDDADAIGDVWDGDRGEGIDAVYCDGTTGLSEFYYSRAKDDAKARWTLGGSAGTDLVGKLLVLHDPISDEPLACGEIVAEAESDAGEDSDAAEQPELRLEGRAALAGMCTLKSVLRDGTDECPQPQALVDCATTHCELASCYSQCTDYLHCIEPEADVCAAPSCTIDQTCIACMSRVFQCEVDFCVDAIACGKPTPGGPCSKLEDCCRTQGDYAGRCLMLVHQLASLSGDPTCVGVMKDWDWNTHLPVACTYE